MNKLERDELVRQLCEIDDSLRMRATTMHADALMRVVARIKRMPVSDAEPVAWRRMELGDWQYAEREFYLAEPLYAAPPALPDGWVAVPMEPDANMRTSGRQARQDGFSEIAIYDAMLAARPEAR